MRIFQVRRTYIENLDKKGFRKDEKSKKWYDFLKHKKEPVEITVDAIIFVYDHEYPVSVASKVLFDTLLNTVVYMERPIFDMFENGGDIEYKHIELSDVNEELITNFDQWTRFARLKRHPDFNWDEYVLKTDNIDLNRYSEIKIAHPSMYSNSDIDVKESYVSNIIYRFSSSDDTCKLLQEVSASDLRYKVLDPIDI